MLPVMPRNRFVLLRHRLRRDWKRRKTKDWLKDMELYIEALDLLQHVVEELPINSAIRRKQDARRRRQLLITGC